MTRALRLGLRLAFLVACVLACVLALGQQPLSRGAAKALFPSRLKSASVSALASSKPRVPPIGTRLHSTIAKGSLYSDAGTGRTCTIQDVAPDGTIGVTAVVPGEYYNSGGAATAMASYVEWRVTVEYPVGSTPTRLYSADGRDYVVTHGAEGVLSTPNLYIPAGGTYKLHCFSAVVTSYTDLTQIAGSVPQSHIAVTANLDRITAGSDLTGTIGGATGTAGGTYASMPIFLGGVPASSAASPSYCILGTSIETDTNDSITTMGWMLRGLASSGATSNNQVERRVVHLGISGQAASNWVSPGFGNRVDLLKTADIILVAGETNDINGGTAAMESRALAVLEECARLGKPAVIAKIIPRVATSDAYATVANEYRCGSQITGIANNGSGLVRLSFTSTGTKQACPAYQNGNSVTVRGTSLYDGTYTISGATTTGVDLVGSTYSAAGTFATAGIENNTMIGYLTAYNAWLDDTSATGMRRQTSATILAVFSPASDVECNIGGTLTSGGGYVVSTYGALFSTTDELHPSSILQARMGVLFRAQRATIEAAYSQVAAIPSRDVVAQLGGDPYSLVDLNAQVAMDERKRLVLR